MKICPQCQTSYTDDTLRFCLQDGSPLSDQAVSAKQSETETVVSPRQTERIRADLTNAQSQNWTQSRETPLPEPPRKSNTALIVAVTALLTILVIGAVATGVLYYKRGGRAQTARNTNSKPANSVAPNVSNANQSQNTNLNANLKVNSNANATPAVTPKPTLNPKEIKDIRSNVENVVDDWRNALENLDLNAHLGNYADTVDYYNGGRIGIGAVRADKQRAFDAYDNIDIDISNLRVTADETGEKAVALFDKKWNFEGEGKKSNGKVRQELQLVKIDGKWRISGEKDLYVYR